MDLNCNLDMYMDKHNIHINVYKYLLIWKYKFIH